MIESISATLDVYSHLRVEVALRDATKAKTEARAEARRRERNVTPQNATETESQPQRAPRQLEAEAERNLIRYAQSSLDGDSLDSGAAEELQPTLTASVLPSDPRMASVARLYQRNGRTAASRDETVGTQFSAYA